MTTPTPTTSTPATAKPAPDPADLPFVYHPDYVCPLPDGHRFPMPKFGMIYRHLRQDCNVPDQQFHQPTRPSRDQLERVHTPEYLDHFIAGTLPVDAIKRIGLPWSEALVHRTITAIGGTMLTAELALQSPTRIACNCAGGTHHAYADFGSGFCILNDLAVAAQHLLDNYPQRIKQILILDLDVHQGDGTAHIFQSNPAVFTVSVHCEKQFPLRKQTSNLDIGLPHHLDDHQYLDLLQHGNKHQPEINSSQNFIGLADLLEQIQPDLVFYDAGVDVHNDDRLGHLCLTDAGIAARDQVVLETCTSKDIPVACVIGGGYDRDHFRLAKRHAILHRTALKLNTQQPANLINATQTSP